MISSKRDCLGGNFRNPYLSPLGENSVFSISVKLFNQNICLLLCLYIPQFFKLMQQFVWALYRNFWRLLTWCFCKIVLTGVTCPREVALSYYYLSFCIFTFLEFLYFLGNNIHIIFLADTLGLGITGSVTQIFTSKKPFSVAPSLLVAILRCFDAHFWVCLSVFDICSQFWEMFIFQCLWYTLYSFWIRRKSFNTFIWILEMCCLDM